ncbi:Acetyl esterase/lipase [Amycolatopsis arida]|uniref:Acetyl esterase/lipase n=1 Tax=Amycolatopsis arida TaxID=587909 RepID=A0A1I5SRD5_9PSEU|nr:alpha/beta hydrolase [Amycolatopsis arida]TDX96392.1 acetyl esterase/lipase [Amycolatopsis arida]SFP72846.1 Acetyl esterase/lipase [Amycolatopsis arida]
MTGTTRTEVVFAERETGPLVMDLVLPAGDRPAPVVLWLHGGGWFTGDRSLAPDLDRYFATSGIAMASADYRLSGQALFPAQLHDVRAAVRYLRRHAGELGLDPDAIGLWGSSAGGHLATLAGVTGHLAALPGEPESGDARVRAVAEGYGPVDLARVVADADPPPALAGDNAPETRLLGAPPAEVPDLARSANPLGYVSDAAPPFLIAHGTADVLVRPGQSVLLHEALVAAGVPSTLYLLDGVGHGFLNPAGATELGGPPGMADGRLERPPPPRATRYHSGAGAGTTTFGYDTVGDFFHHHLRSGAHR